MKIPKKIVINYNYFSLKNFILFLKEIYNYNKINEEESTKLYI